MAHAFYGASQWNTFWKIQIPTALPSLFAHIKVASTLAVVGAIIGEFVGSDTDSLPVYRREWPDRCTASFAVIVVLSILGIVLSASSRWPSAAVAVARFAASH